MWMRWSGRWSGGWWWSRHEVRDEQHEERNDVVQSQRRRHRSEVFVENTTLSFLRHNGVRRTSQCDAVKRTSVEETHSRGPLRQCVEHLESVSGRLNANVIKLITQKCRYVMFTEGLRSQMDISQSLSPWKQWRHGSTLHVGISFAVW